MTKCSNWEPILPAHLVQSAEGAINAVTAELIALDRQSQSSRLLCESALLFGYQALVDPLKGWQDLAIEYLNTAAEQNSGRISANALYGGLSGIGWVYEHLGRILADETACGVEESRGEADDLVADIDEVLLNRLERGPWLEPYDLISGLVGIGVYFLERLPRFSGRRGVQLILGHLEMLSEETCEGTTWLTPPEHIVEQYRCFSPSGRYDLGVAHGVPGVLYFLGELVAADIETVRARRLLDGAVQWLLARQRPPHEVCRFASWFMPGVEPADSRLGWCYGDLGVAAILEHVALRIGREEWNSTARTLLDKALAWPRDRDQIRDAQLCHGALGVAHICNRVYQKSHNLRYKEAASLWYERGLSLRSAGQGIAGFFTWRDARNPRMHADASLLSGAIGVALALLAAISAVPPQWDRLLLLSGCVRS